MITTFLNRLGNLGLLLIAVALLLGGLAGAAVAHHYDRLSANTVATQHNGNGSGVKKAKPQHGKQHQRNGGHQNGPQVGDQTETG